MLPEITVIRDFIMDQAVGNYTSCEATFGYNNWPKVFFHKNFQSEENFFLPVKSNCLLADNINET